jgi:hypothetical protein
MIRELIQFLIYCVVIAFVAGGLAYIVRTAPFILSPFKEWLGWAIIAIAILIAILLALQLFPVPI